VLKALLKSKAIRGTKGLVSNMSETTLTSPVSAAVVDPVGLKAYWSCKERLMEAWIWEKKCLTKSISNILERMGVRDLGG